VRYAIIGAILLVAGAAAIAFGVLSGADAYALWQRTWPILLFVVAITVVTELAADAGLFRIAAERLAGWGNGRGWVLWLLVVLLAAVSTIFLSLDTTAVLLTPVVIVLAAHAKLNPLPFALTTVWLANTGSMLLPVSNLTNLLAQHQLGNPSPAAFAALTWAPAVVAILIPAALIFLVYRRSLLTRYSPTAPTPVEDRPLAITSAVVVVALLPALVSGIAVWIPATVAAAILVVVFAVRRRQRLSFSLLPWQLVLFAAGLFLVVEAAQSAGLGQLLSTISGSGDGALDLLRLAGVSGLGGNAINNLPAFLALQPIAHSPERLIAVLIGVNVGPLITPWASLATLLWFERLRALDISFPRGRFIVLGLIAGPITVVAATLALWLAG
jgi:arsenical pump membrane protein